MSNQDSELLRRLANDDADAFNEFVSRWEKPVSRVLRRLLRCSADAEDAGQEVFLRVLNNARNYQPTGSLGGWLYRIAINVARDMARKNKCPPARLEIDPISPSTVSGMEQSVQREQWQAIDHCLNEAPSRDRELIVLKHFAGLTFAEIAAALELPVTTIKSRMAAALKRLQTTLTGYGFYRQELEK